MDYGMDNRGLIPDKSRDFFFISSSHPEAYNSPPSSAEVKNAWRFTSTYICAFMPQGLNTGIVFLIIRIGPGLFS
jgi:hypothetical protein